MTTRSHFASAEIRSPEYVRRTVSDFKDRVKHWETWNEQNLKHFWVADPDSIDISYHLAHDAPGVIAE